MAHTLEDAIKIKKSLNSEWIRVAVYNDDCESAKVERCTLLNSLGLPDRWEDISDNYSVVGNLKILDKNKKEIGYMKEGIAYSE